MYPTKAIFLATIMATSAVVAHAAAPAWKEGASYTAGSSVSYAGHDYQALVTHTAFVGAGWTPAATPTLWRDLGPSSGSVATPQPSAAPTTAPTASPAPTVAPTPTPTATPIPTATSPASANCLPAWQSGMAYTSGQRVSYQGVNYEAKWWSNTAPTNEQWGAWKNLGRCDSATPAPSATPAIPTSGLLFDDFSYTSTSQLSNNGWLLRSWDGAPGLGNGQWSPSNISFIADPQQAGNTVMRLKASTNINGDQIENNKSTAGNISQVELLTSDSIYLYGTWAARMYFNDAPVRGPDGDSVIQTFFGITRYVEGVEPYSEIDFEYLPNGGWGTASPTMWMTSYEIAPRNNVYETKQQSFAGWHTLVMNVEKDKIRFFIDGVEQYNYSGVAQPDHPMYIAFQLWFSNGRMPDGRPGFLQTNELREYQEDVDWVLHLKDQQLNLNEVEGLVGNLRSNGLGFVKNIK